MKQQNLLLKILYDDYNICICEGNKYMKVNNIWINDEKLTEKTHKYLCRFKYQYIYILFF